MFPYHDENETQRFPIVTVALIGLNCAAWFMLQGAGESMMLAKSVCELGLIPGELTGRLPVGTTFPMAEGLYCATDPGMQVSNILSSMFLHGSWFHLLGNMWFLWLFGNNIEDSMGHARFVLFYLLCGVVAALAQVFVNPDSFIPMVGASGAISGVMGAYLLLYPRVRVFVMVPLGFYPLNFAVPAWIACEATIVAPVAAEQPSDMSSAQPRAPIASWTSIAIAGYRRCRFDAPSTTRSTSSPLRPARASAFFAAFTEYSA